MVEVVIGQPSRTFTLYKTLLSQRSPFFQAAFNGPQMEAARDFIPFEEDGKALILLQQGNKRSIALPEENPEAFGIFVFWLYKDQLPLLCDGNIATVIDFYVLTDKLQLPPQLKLQALDSIKVICSQAKDPLQAQVVARVLKVTARDCPLRRLILDLACYIYYYNDLTKDGSAEQSKWLKECLKDCDIAEAVEVFGIFKDALVESQRLKSTKRHRWTVSQAIDGHESLASLPRYQIGFIRQHLDDQGRGEAIEVD